MHGEDGDIGAWVTRRYKYIGTLGTCELFALCSTRYIWPRACCPPRSCRGSPAPTDATVPGAGPAVLRPWCARPLAVVSGMPSALWALQSRERRAVAPVIWQCFRGRRRRDCGSARALTRRRSFSLVRCHLVLPSTDLLQEPRSVCAPHPVQTDAVRRLHEKLDIALRLSDNLSPPACMFLSLSHLVHLLPMHGRRAPIC